MSYRLDKETVTETLQKTTQHSLCYRCAGCKGYSQSNQWESFRISISTLLKAVNVTYGTQAQFN